MLTAPWRLLKDRRQRARRQREGWGSKVAFQGEDAPQQLLQPRLQSLVVPEVPKQQAEAGLHARANSLRLCEHRGGLSPAACHGPELRKASGSQRGLRTEQTPRCFLRLGKRGCSPGCRDRYCTRGSFAHHSVETSGGQRRTGRARPRTARPEAASPARAPLPQPRSRPGPPLLRAGAEQPLAEQGRPGQARPGQGRQAQAPRRKPRTSPRAAGSGRLPRPPTWAGARRASRSPDWLPRRSFRPRGRGQRARPPEGVRHRGATAGSSPAACGSARCHGGGARPAAARRPRCGDRRRPCGLGGGEQRSALPGRAGGAGECGAGGAGGLGQGWPGRRGPRTAPHRARPGPPWGAEQGVLLLLPGLRGPSRLQGLRYGAGEKRRRPPPAGERPRFGRLLRPARRSRDAPVRAGAWGRRLRPSRRGQPQGARPAAASHGRGRAFGSSWRDVSCHSVVWRVISPAGNSNLPSCRILTVRDSELKSC